MQILDKEFICSKYHFSERHPLLLSNLNVVKRELVAIGWFGRGV